MMNQCVQLDGGDRKRNNISRIPFDREICIGNVEELGIHQIPGLETRTSGRHQQESSDPKPKNMENRRLLVLLAIYCQTNAGSRQPETCVKQLLASAWMM